MCRVKHSSGGAKFSCWAFFYICVAFVEQIWILKVSCPVKQSKKVSGSHVVHFPDWCFKFELFSPWTESISSLRSVLALVMFVEIAVSLMKKKKGFIFGCYFLCKHLSYSKKMFVYLEFQTRRRMTLYHFIRYSLHLRACVQQMSGKSFHSFVIFGLISSW